MKNSLSYRGPSSEILLPVVTAETFTPDFYSKAKEDTLVKDLNFVCTSAPESQPRNISDFKFH